MAPVTKTVLKAPFGSLGLPPNTKEAGQRGDFYVNSLFLQIEAHGYRLAWTRAAICPCVSANPQSHQADPQCALCSGRSYYYFGSSAAQDLSKESLNDAQKAQMRESNAFLIRGIMTSIGVRDEAFQQHGSWRHGQANVTVHPNNRIAFRDHLVNLDANVVYNEVVNWPGDPSQPLPLRYKVSGPVYLCRSLQRVYNPGADFTGRQGKLYFIASSVPDPGTLITVTYTTFPVWVVDDMPHAARLTNILFKTPQPISPEGNVQELPIQASVKLEFLPGDQ